MNNICFKGFQKVVSPIQETLDILLDKITASNPRHEPWKPILSSGGGGDLEPAFTIELNLPWLSSSSHNGWKQIKHMPAGETVFFNGNETTSTNTIADVSHGTYFDYSTNPKASQWQRTATQAGVSKWNEICFQTYPSSGSVDAWVIFTKDQYANLWHLSPNYGLIELTSNDYVAFRAPQGYSELFRNINETDNFNPMILFKNGDGQRPAIYMEENDIFLNRPQLRFVYNDLMFYHGLAVFVREQINQD